MSGTALQLVEKRQPDQDLQRQGGLQLRSLEDLQAFGQIFAKSGFFGDTKDAAQAIVKVMAGQELGFPPIASMTGVYIVKGKVSLSANLMAAAIKGSNKYDYKVRRLDVEACTIEFFEGGQSIGVSTFSMAEAQAARLHQDWDKERKEWKDKPTWKSFPRNMLFARAMSNGAKWFAPDIFKGPVYTPEELGATVDGETGEVIEASVEIATPVEPAPAADLATPETLAAIDKLWDRYGRQETGAINFNDYIYKKLGLSHPTVMTQADAVKMLEWLQKKALAVIEPAGEQRADKGSGLDQWRCTKETQSRQLAMDVLNATKRLEATGVDEIQWREELNAIFHNYPQPVSRKSLTCEEIRETWMPLIQEWAKRNEAKKGASAQ